MLGINLALVGAYVTLGRHREATDLVVLLFAHRATALALRMAHAYLEVR